MVWRLLILAAALAVGACSTTPTSPDPQPVCNLAAKVGLAVGTQVTYETTVERTQYEAAFGTDVTSTTVFTEIMTVDGLENVDGHGVYRLVFRTGDTMDTLRIAASDDSLAVHRAAAASVGHDLPMTWLPIMSCSVGVAGRRASDTVAQEYVPNGVGSPPMVTVRHRCEERWTTHTTVSVTDPNAIIGRINITDTATIVGASSATFENGTSQRIVETSLAMMVANGVIREWVATTIEMRPATARTFCAITIHRRAVGSDATP